MNTIISNNITIYNPDSYIIAWANANLIVVNPVYKQLKMRGKEDVIKYKHVPEKLNLFYQRHNSISFPFGTLYSIWDYIKKFHYEIKMNKTKSITIINDTPTDSLIDYQEKAVNYMIEKKGGVLVSQCGSGKTYMGIELIKRIGKKTLWLCHTKDLLVQAKDDMLNQYSNIKLGLTTEGSLNIGEDVTIATVQTMDRIDPELYKNEFEIVICDECAHVAGSPTQMKMFQRIISNIPARYKYGLTATPTRSDGMIKAMYAYIGVSANGKFEPTYKVKKEEVKNTITAEHIKYDINSGYDKKERMFELYDTSGMLIYNNLIDSLIANQERTNKIIENVIKCNQEGRKQVILSSRILHCEDIAAKLQNLGLNAVLCIGKVSDKKRTKIIKQEEEWDIVVATYALLKEGISIKELDTLHLATPIKDKGMIVQCAGRIERLVADKKQPVIYDYVDVDIPYCVNRFKDRQRALKRRF